MTSLLCNTCTSIGQCFNTLYVITTEEQPSNNHRQYDLTSHQFQLRFQWGPCSLRVPLHLCFLLLTCYPFPSTYPKGVHVRRHVSLAAIGLDCRGDTLLLPSVCLYLCTLMFWITQLPPLLLSLRFLPFPPLNCGFFLWKFFLVQCDRTEGVVLSYWYSVQTVKSTETNVTFVILGYINKHWLIDWL